MPWDNWSWYRTWGLGAMACNALGQSGQLIPWCNARGFSCWVILQRSLVWSDVKRPRPMLNDVGLHKSLALWLCEQDLVTFLLTIQKFSTRIHHVTGIVRQSIERTITHNCRNFIEWYGYTWYHFGIPNDLPAKPMMHINMFEYNASSCYSTYP